MSGEVKDECGIAAVYIKENGDSANRALFYLYKILLNLQNRGQLSAGITTYDPKRKQLLDTYKNLGPVNEVFRTSSKLKSIQIFKRYAGNKGIGHVRYATSGSEARSLAQPFERHHGRKWKWFSFCFNGNLANFQELKNNLLQKTDYHIIHDTDTEIIMHYIAREIHRNKFKPNLFNTFSNLSKKFDGCYNLAFINAQGEMAILRDPYGFRPLCYGKFEDTFLAASESNALTNCGITDHKDLNPGEMITINNGDINIKRFAKNKKTAHCMFEWVYFSNVSSVLDGKSVYITRTNLGRELAKLETEDINHEHVLVPVPDTAKAAGDSMAYELGIPSKEGLMRNRFVGRTFIEGSSRQDRVQNKYTALTEILKDKKVILVDDSVVRGTTIKQIIKYLKKEGKAKEVHLRVSCPPIRGPCFYGIDMPTVSELLVPSYEGEPVNEDISEKTCAKIAKDVGADSLIYQTIPGLIKSIGLPKNKLCMACLNGEYPTPCGKILFKKAWDNFRKGEKKELSC
ncbi:amidophosphoribosyltransferase [Candidatus Woesearchaeota archaeon]|nr:amidophosphoribosyltransferase [Candidatus Woesearchaeota archaeon]